MKIKIILFFGVLLSSVAQAHITSNSLVGFADFLAKNSAGVAIQKIDFTSPVPYMVEGKIIKGGKPRDCMIKIVGDADNPSRKMMFKMVQNNCK